MDNKELRLGKMPTEEIAQWFGVAFNTYTNRKAKYLTKLEDYCKFERYHGGVNILEIYQSTYDKNFSQNIEKKFYDEICRCIKEQDGLATVSGIVNRIGESKYYVSKSRNKLFGFISSGDLVSHGLLGSRYATWAIKISDYNEYRKMTQEESDIFTEVLENYIKRPHAKEDIAYLGELLKEFKHNLITKERFLSCATSITNNFYYDVVFGFQLRTGQLLVKASCYQFDTNYDNLEEQQAYLKTLNKIKQ